MENGKPPTMTDTVTVKLSFPLFADGRVVSEVAVRRPKVKDLRAMERARRHEGGDMEQGIAMICVLCNLPLEAVDEMDSADFAAVSKVLGDFLPRAPVPEGGAAS